MCHQGFLERSCCLLRCYSGQRKDHSMSRSKGTRTQSHCDFSLALAGHVCACAHVCMSHTQGCISRCEAIVGIYFLLFTHFSPIPTFSLKVIYYFYNQKNMSKCYFKKGSQCYGNPLVHVRLSLGPGMRIPFICPGQPKGETASQHLHRNYCGIWN